MKRGSGVEECRGSESRCDLWRVSAVRRLSPPMRGWRRKLGEALQSQQSAHARKRPALWVLSAVQIAYFSHAKC
jgi:hypothetical protein